MEGTRLASRALALGFGALVLSSTGALRAENWPHWRGPFFNGSTTEANLPDHWSKTENVVWSAPLPGKSGATPVVWGDSVFVSTPDGEKNLLLLCLEAKDGKVRWRKIVAGGDREVAKSNMTAPSPVTDGNRVFVVYGTGDLAAFDFTGKPLWARNLAADYGKFAIQFYYSSSPLLYQGKLYLEAVQRNPPKAYKHAIDDKPVRESYLLCIDPQNGKTVWRQIRQTDASGESMDAYTSPVPFEGEHGPEVIVYGAGFVTSHRPGTGEENWRCGSLNPNLTGYWRTICSPVTGPGLVFACVPRGKSPLVAVKGGGSGLVPISQIAWRATNFWSDVSTPLYYRNKLFVLNCDKQTVTCVDPQTGAMKWEGNLGVKESFTASPTGADGKLYCIGEAGTVAVVSAGDEFKLLSTFKMEGEAAQSQRATNGIPLVSASGSSAPILSSIAAANGHLFVRTPQNLYCIGRKM